MYFVRHFTNKIRSKFECQPLWPTLVCLLVCQGYALVAVHAEMSEVVGTSAIKPFELGQRWVYSHEGPRPQAMEPNAINGQRILQIVSRDARSGQAVWCIEERFTGDPNVVGRLYVDEERRLRSIEVTHEKGEATSLIYEPSIAYQAMAMQVGGQTVVKTQLRTGDGKFKIPIQMGVRRFEDETVMTAAGRFEGCRHFEFVTKSTIDLKLVKIPMQETHHRWYSDQVNGLVKEVYQKAPGKFMTWSWEGYTSTSTLVSFGAAAIDQNAVQAVEPASAGSDRGPETAALRRPDYYLRLLGVLGALFFVACAFVIVRVAKHRR